MEELFSLIIEKAYTLEFKEYENPPRHFFSLKHRRKMKRLFENKGVDYSDNAARQSKKKIPAVAIALAIIVSLLVPAAAAAFSYTALASVDKVTIQLHFQLIWIMRRKQLNMYIYLLI